MIKNDGLNLVRNALYGDTVDLEINYLGVIDSADAIILWTPIIDRIKGATGVLETVFEALDTDGALEIRKVRFYAGATSTPGSGTLISTIDWTKDKTNLESIQFDRTDTIGRG